MASHFRNPALFNFLIVLNMISWDCFGQACWLNDPFAPFVKLELSVERDGMLLKLRNDFQKLVRLKRVTMLVEGTESPISLLREPVDLPPADRHYLKLGNTLIEYFDKEVQEQEKVVRFRLSLEPEPIGQPEECGYRVTLERRRFTSCVRIPEEGQQGIGMSVRQ